MTRRAKVIAAATLLFVALALVLYWRSHDQDVAWLSSAPQGRSARLGFLGSSFAPVKRELRRLKEYFTGPTPLVFVTVRLLDLTPDTVSVLPEVKTSATNEAGDRVLALSEASTAERLLTMRGARILAAPQLGTADGMHSQVSFSSPSAGASGEPVNLGWWVHVVSRVRREELDLSCYIVGTEQNTNGLSAAGTSPAFVTNLTLGARAVVGTNGGVLLVSARTNANGRVTAALVSGRVFHPPRK
jgi:hypothetical protein